VKTLVTSASAYDRMLRTVLGLVGNKNEEALWKLATFSNQLTAFMNRLALDRSYDPSCNAPTAPNKAVT
jgi:hypothetical protein